jgi:hypothetical protein
MTLLDDTGIAHPASSASHSSPVSSASGDLALPTYDPHHRLVTRHDLDDRIRELLPTALVHQLWLLLFDADDVQMPAMIPIGDLPLGDAPRAGGAPGGAEGVADLLTTLDREFGVASYVFVLERPGSADLTPVDRHWLDVLLGIATGRPFTVRAVYLCHDDGVTGFQEGEVSPD